MNREPIAVSYGGGVNSTALLVGLIERGEPVDLIMFSDTGAERPETYAYVRRFSEWLISHGYPEILWTHARKLDGSRRTLEQTCRDKHMLPSLAYGFKKCSLRYKAEPQERELNNWAPAREAWASGRLVLRHLGIDAGELRRAKYYEHSKFRWSYPLIEWGWRRHECMEAIRRAGLCVPAKSACFFCPASKKHEILRLKADHPDLLARALAIEDGAQPFLETAVGLGRRFRWRDLIEADDAQERLFDTDIWDSEIPCGCWDGTEEAA